MSVACPKCRAENDPGSRFCRMCAAPLAPEGGPATMTRSFPPPAPDPARGVLFAGKYLILRELGRGGMGIVYEAEQQNPKRPVALKVIRGGPLVTEIEIRMFQREAQALARLKHPHIASVFESGRTEDGCHYFAMELVRGETLTGYLAPRGRAGRLAPEEIRLRLRLFRKICDAVNYAHQRGIIHRDLKPSNVIVQSDSSAGLQASDPVPEIKILDFGLARVAETDLAASAMISEAGRTMGTLPYMSPEQVRGNPDEIDVRSDVYALGVVLYEMLTGVLPYDSTRASPTTLAKAIVEDPPRPIAKSWRGVRKSDNDIQTIVAKTLEKEPVRRYQSAAALSEDIERYLQNQPIAARPASGLYQLRKLIARHKVGAGIAAAAVVVLAAFALAMTLLSARIARERTRAEKEAAKAYAINDFLLQTIGSANPVEGVGRDTTVLEALKSATEKIASHFAGQPEVEAELRTVIGLTYLRLGRYREAEDLLHSACRVREEASGPDALELASPLTGLGVLKHERGELAAAESLYRRALAIVEKKKGVAHPDVLSILNNLALLLQDEEKLDEAESLFRRILDADQRTSRPGDITVALDLNNLGNLLLWKGDLAAAEPVLRRAVEGFEQKGHPWRSIAKGNLAFLLSRKGAHREAATIFAEALPAALKDFGEDNQDVAKLRYKYGTCMLELRRYEEAEGLLRAAFPVLDGSLGRGDEWTRRTIKELVRLYDAWGKPDEAGRFKDLVDPVAEETER